MKGRWGKVRGPMAGAAATLWDFEWEVPEVSRWVSPDSVPRIIDFSEQNLDGILREVLGHYFQLSIWHKAKACDDGEVPDLTEVRRLMRRGRKAKDHRQTYWLDSVAQGALDAAFCKFAVFDEGLV